jgi:hypothetical protein
MWIYRSSSVIFSLMAEYIPLGLGISNAVGRFVGQFESEEDGNRYVCVLQVGVNGTVELKTTKLPSILPKQETMLRKEQVAFNGSRESHFRANHTFQVRISWPLDDRSFGIFRIALQFSLQSPTPAL